MTTNCELVIISTDKNKDSLVFAQITEHLPLSVFRRRVIVIFRDHLQIEESLHTILQIFSIAAIEKITIIQLLRSSTRQILWAGQVNN